MTSPNDRVKLGSRSHPLPLPHPHHASKGEEKPIDCCKNNKIQTHRYTHTAIKLKCKNNEALLSIEILVDGISSQAPALKTEFLQLLALEAYFLESSPKLTAACHCLPCEST